MWSTCSNLWTYYPIDSESFSCTGLRLFYICIQDESSSYYSFSVQEICKSRGKGCFSCLDTPWHKRGSDYLFRLEVSSNARNSSFCFNHLLSLLSEDAVEMSSTAISANVRRVTLTILQERERKQQIIRYRVTILF